MTKRILIADDDRVVLEICKRKLIERGHQVETAMDGVEALELLTHHQFDLLILDIQMHYMNGYTLVLEKEKIPSIKDIPVIILTSHTEMEPLLKRHSIQAYLTKPLQFEQLLEQVQLILK